MKLITTLALLLFSQTMAAQRDAVAELMPNGVPTVLHLPSESRKPVVTEQLLKDQKTSSGKRAQQIAFLLAALGERKQSNVEYLLKSLRGCSAHAKGCDEGTAALVIGLYDRGEHSVLTPLLSAGLNGDGALSEVLGDFYGEVLSNNTSAFIEALSRLGPEATKSVCFLAGTADGGGMAPVRLAKVRKQLKSLNTPEARSCSTEVEKANRPDS
jgi:hypothetical protein